MFRICIQYPPKSKSMKQRLAQYGPRLIMMATVLCLMTTLVAAAERKPNIIVIVADDLGYADAERSLGRFPPDLHAGAETVENEQT